MDERKMQFRVGVTVLAAFILTAIMVVLFGEIPLMLRRSYTIYIVFPQAPGVSRDTPVRKSGILIGRVASVDLADDAGVIVTARIDEGRRLSRNEVCQIRGSLLGGDAVLEFVPSGQGLQGGELQNGDRIAGLVASDPLQAISSLEGSLSRALNSVAGTSDEIGRLTRRVTDLLAANDEQFTRIVNQTEQAVSRIRSIVDGADKILGDEAQREKLRVALADMPDLMKEARQSLATMQGTLESARNNLQNFEQVTRPLGENGGKLAADLTDSIRSLKMIMASMGQLLDSPDSPLRRLLSDPALFQNVSDTVANIHAISRDLRPIIRDARALSDKISRHPELLGVGGAIRGSSGIK